MSTRRLESCGWWGCYLKAVGTPKHFGDPVSPDGCMVLVAAGEAASGIHDHARAVRPG